MEQILEKLFESIPKVRILRLFMQNPDSILTLEEIPKRTQVRLSVCRKELEKLKKIGLVKDKIATIREKVEKNSRSKNKHVKIISKFKKKRVFWANKDFDLFNELKELITKSSTASKDRILKQIKKVGRVKLLVLSGVFIGHENARTDLLIVGDDIIKRKLDTFLLQTESELGKPVQYTLMETDEFKYRLGMYDRFLRDILEYPHEKLINRLDIQ